MNKQRIILIIAAAVGMLGTFLPWVSIPFLGGMNGTHGDGWITFFMFLVALVVAVLGDIKSAVSGWPKNVGIVVAAIASIVGIYDILNIKNAMGGSMGNMVSIGFGLYVIIIAGLAYIGVSLGMKE